jgi:3-hydroxyisobutyrate dehydrogenase-like beta-hydroxyacid dehydrogenase
MVKRTPTSSLNVGLVGCGIMGVPMAHRLVEAGHRVTVLDKDADALTRAKALGCATAPTPAALAAQSSIILLSLPRPEHVRFVVSEGADCLLDGAIEGSVIADTSTVDPETSRHNAELAAGRGVGYLDCPILGRPSNVGGWTLPVGGESEHLELARPVLKAFASNVIHLGPVGQGNTLKLLNNLMFGAINSITAEVFALSDHLDIDRRLLYETIANSGAATVSNLFKELGRKIVDEEFTPNFTVDNLVKDVGLGIEMAASSGLLLQLSETGQSMNRRAQEMGLGGEDSAAVVKIYDQPQTNETEPNT